MSSCEESDSEWITVHCRARVEWNEIKVVSASTRRAHAGRFHVFRSNKIRPIDAPPLDRSTRGASALAVRLFVHRSQRHWTEWVHERRFTNHQLDEQDLPDTRVFCDADLVHIPNSSHRACDEHPPSTTRGRSIRFVRFLYIVFIDRCREHVVAFARCGVRARVRGGCMERIFAVSRRSLRRRRARVHRGVVRAGVRSVSALARCMRRRRTRRIR
jgi:hypothetical protein